MPRMLLKTPMAAGYRDKAHPGVDEKSLIWQASLLSPFTDEPIKRDLVIGCFPLGTI